MTQKHLLLDTNILVYLTYPQSVFRTIAQESLKKEILQGAKLYVTMQILREYAKVMTGTKDPFTSKSYSNMKETLEAIRQFQQNMITIGDSRQSFGMWLELVETYDVKGRSVFDAQIAAQMLQNNITHILTNDERFSRYSNIITITPLGAGAS
jgi:predicted nucleic acid-binding protein